MMAGFAPLRLIGERWPNCRRRTLVGEGLELRAVSTVVWPLLSRLSGQASGVAMLLRFARKGFEQVALAAGQAQPVLSLLLQFKVWNWWIPRYKQNSRESVRRKRL